MITNFKLPLTILLGIIVLIISSFFSLSFNLPISHSILYVWLFGGIIILITHKLYDEDYIIQISIKNVLFFSILSGVFIALSLSMYDGNLSSYYRFSPLYDAAINNRWHQDTAFNISLIRSILNFGYPSVALDGHPFTSYHILSHYIDAFLFAISGLDPYTSYGFTSLIKSIFLMYVIYILSYRLLKDKNLSVLSFFILCPLIIASWHIIVSHALWSIGYLLLFTIPMVFNFLKKEITIRKYTIISFLSMLMCLGKISTGFAFILFVFSFLFIRDYSKKRFYIFSIIICLFILVYQKFINYSYGISPGLDFSSLSADYVLKIISSSSYGKSFVCILVVQYMMYFLLKEKYLLYTLYSTFLSFIPIVIITSTFSGFNMSDRYYFYQGWYSVVILFTILSAVDVIENEQVVKNKLSPLLLLFLISFYAPQPIFSLSRISIEAVKSKYNYLINEKFKELIIDGSSPLTSLVGFVDDVISNTNIPKSKIAIFIPKSELENSFISTKDMKDRRRIFYTMNLYAITGVQLVNGFIGQDRAYGLANYSPHSFPVENINYMEKCLLLKLERIIKVVNYKESRFEIIECKIQR